jgi:hypothetical protein
VPPLQCNNTRPIVSDRDAASLLSLLLTTSKLFLLRAALAFAPLLSAAAGAADIGPRVRGAAVAETCASAAEWRLGRPSGAHLPAVAEARAAPELPAREGGSPEPPIRRAPRCARWPRCARSEAARVHASMIARLDAIPRLAAALRGVHFGSTAPPPLPS